MRVRAARWELSDNCPLRPAIGEGDRRPLEVDSADIIKGYEVGKGDYIELDPEELEAVAIESKRTIDIDEFVPKDEIDELYLKNPYYIAPDGEVGQQAFAVIRGAIRKEGMVAIGKVVFTSREHIIALEAGGKGLLGITLRYPYEVRNEADYFDDIPDEKIPKDMPLAARATASGALPVIGFLDASSAAERTAQVGPAVAQRADVAEPA